MISYRRFFMFECPKCDYKHESINSMRIHAQKKHGIQSIELWMHYNGSKPTCGCSCGIETKFLGLKKGFAKYIRGHAARVNNNWGHNKEAQKKSQDTRREKGTFGFQKGYTPWNKGLTKEDHPSVASMASIINSRSGEYSSRMSKNRLDGTVPTNWGKDHPQWKGGKSRLTALCHSSKRLYSEWKYPALLKSGFSCEKCKASGNLHVHHDQEWMSAIIKIVLDGKDERELTFEERLVEAERVAEYHVNNKVSSEVLCEACHKEEHSFLNF